MMVLGMSTYNLLLHQSFSLGTLLKGYVPAFLVAFTIEKLVISKVAKAVIRKAPINHDKPLHMIVTTACCMVLGMSACMSLYGVILQLGFPENMLSSYLHTWKMNLIMALPLQLFIVGPLSRKILAAIQG